MRIVAPIANKILLVRLNLPKKKHIFLLSDLTPFMEIVWFPNVNRGTPRNVFGLKILVDVSFINALSNM